MPEEVFEASSRDESRENVLAAVLVAVLVPVYLWFGRNERGWQPLVLFGLGGGVLTWLFYTLRSRRTGMLRIRISEEAITVERQRGTVTLRWEHVCRARRSLYGGERWLLQTQRPHPSLSFWIDGFPDADRSRMNELIRKLAPVR